MTQSQEALVRSQQFATRMGLLCPVLLAPMAGACPASLSIAVANGGGMGACGVLMMSPDAITSWVREVRESTDGLFQLNNWIPDPLPVRNTRHEQRVRSYLEQWGPPVPESAVETPVPDFETQCEAMLAAKPAAISSIMGLYPQPFVARMKSSGIRWFATVTTVAEALQAEQAGADVIVAQGMEAGGHRGAFNQQDAEGALVGLFSLLPAVVDVVSLPVVATGGIADARGAAAAMLLGASAVQIGTGLLRTTEAGIASVWSDALGNTAPEDTAATRAFSGRLGRSIKTSYVEAMSGVDAPKPAPFPIQRNLTQPMRAAAATSNRIDTMQVWAGQSARLARIGSATDVVKDIWSEVESTLG